MKRFLLITAAAALAMGLTACSAWDELTGSATTAEAAGAAVGVSSSTVDTVMLDAKKGLAAAHSAHEAVADLAGTLAKTGVLKGQNAALAKQWVDESESYLKIADGLVAAGDATGIEAQIAKANVLIAQVQGLASGGT